MLALNVRQHRGFRYWRSGRDATGKSLIWVGRADIEERVTLIGSEHFGDDALDCRVFANMRSGFVGLDDRSGLHNGA